MQFKVQGNLQENKDMDDYSLSKEFSEDLEQISDGSDDLKREILDSKSEFVHFEYEQ